MFARLGSFCYHRRWLVVALWLVVLVVGGGLGSQVFPRLHNPGGSRSVESVQAFRQLDDASTTGPRVLAVVDGRRVDDAATRRDVLRAVGRIRQLPGVAAVYDGYDTPLPELRATDGNAQALAIDLKRDLSTTAKTTAINAVRATLRTVPAAHVTLGGSRVEQDEINAQVRKDLEVGEFISLPIALVVLVFIFGGIVAALRPLAVAFASIAGGLGVLYAFSFAMDLDPNVPSVVTVMGLGLAIDYGLLMANRFREERLAGYDAPTAVQRTVTTAGRAIMFSALTVMAALSGLFAFDEPTYRGMGAGGVSVVLVALLAALTLTPALLSFSRHAERLPTEARGIFHRFSRPAPDEGFFSATTRRAQRVAVPLVVVLVALLASAATPFLGARFSNGTTSVLPRSFEARQTDQLLRERFPGNKVDPIQVVGDAPATDLRVLGYARQLQARPDVASVEVARGIGLGLSVVNVYPKGDSQGEAAQQLVRTLRADRPAYPTKVTGAAAFLVDFKHQIATGLPWALTLIAAATFVLLFLMTGSVLVPLKALVMNVLSLGASFGALVWIFQQGHLSGLLGFDSDGTIQTWVPVIVFVFAFGLSMDYEVFLLSRVKELYDEGLRNDDAVRQGLQRTGRIITSAALLIVVVFAGFAAGKMVGIKQMGMALSIAVLVDATLVRCLLVPATMTLLGDLNWWAPGPLRRLHARFGLREAPADEAVPGQRAEYAADELPARR